jgi:hypothetical protein
MSLTFVWDLGYFFFRFRFIKKVFIRFCVNEITGGARFLGFVEKLVFFTIFP